MSGKPAWDYLRDACAEFGVDSDKAVNAGCAIALERGTTSEDEPAGEDRLTLTRKGSHDQ